MGAKQGGLTCASLSYDSESSVKLRAPRPFHVKLVMLEPPSSIEDKRGTRHSGRDNYSKVRRKNLKHRDSGDKNLNFLKCVRPVLLSPHHLTNGTQNTPVAHHFLHRFCNQTQEAKHQDPTRMPQDCSLSLPAFPRPHSQPSAITDRKDASSSLKQNWAAREREP
ncbi:hypothetical protein Bca101_014188 [Brassica carinata]